MSEHYFYRRQILKSVPAPKGKMTHNLSVKHMSRWSRPKVEDNCVLKVKEKKRNSIDS